MLHPSLMAFCYLRIKSDAGQHSQFFGCFAKNANSLAVSGNFGNSLLRMYGQNRTGNNCSQRYFSHKKIWDSPNKGNEKNSQSPLTGRFVISFVQDLSVILIQSQTALKTHVKHGYPLLSANWIIFLKTFVFPGLFGHSYGTL